MIDSVVSVGGFERVGVSGEGAFNQEGNDPSLSDGPTLGCTPPVKPPTTPPGPPPSTGPTHSVGKNLYLGDEPLGIGTFNMEGGKLTVNGSIRVGRLGIGTFNQTEGTVTSKGNDPETLETTVQSGGTQEVFNLRRMKGKTSKLECHPVPTKGPALIIGQNNIGGYNLYGGTLNVGDSEIIGYAGPPDKDSDIIGNGSFYQTGGNHNVSGNFFMSKQLGSFSEYSFYGPDIYDETEPTPAEISLLDVRGFGSIGYEGEGNFYQTGGTVKFRGTDKELSNFKVSSGIGMALSKTSAIQNLGCNTQNQYIGLTIGREGKGGYYLTEGELLVSRGEIIGVFPQSEGYFGHSSGNHYVGGTLTIARDPGSQGIYDLWDGTLVAHGGTVNNGTFNFSGGMIQGKFTNNGTFNVAGTNTKPVSGNFINSETGRVSALNANLAFTKNFLNEGIYESTLSSSKFKNLTIKTNGFIKAGEGIGDYFTVSGNFTNESKNSQWNTAFAKIEFTGAGTHYFKTGGNSFAWGAFSLADKAVVRLQGNLSAQNIDGVIAENNKIKNMYGFCGIRISYTDSNPDLEGNWLYTSPWGKKVGKFVNGQLDTSQGCK